MFRVIKGSHYWQPVVELSIKKGDIIFFEKRNGGVLLSKTDNINAGFIFFSELDFETHFDEVSQIRDNKIKDILK